MGRFHATVAIRRVAVSTIASELLAALPAAPPMPGSVVTLREDRPRDAGRYRAVIDNDPARPLDLMPATPAEIARIAALAIEARALLARTCPPLADEIDTLGHEIVLATSGGLRGFGGAASVFLWGAVVLNPTRVHDRVTMAESLAHETAHAMLFGLTLGVDLTTNDPTERHGSPLRPDPCPIEGIVHATYVLARMIYALDHARRSERLDETERALIETKLERNRADYEAGLATVDAHARFTEDGAAIFAACRRAMATSGASA